MIPVVDLFAGPGGLGEGFASYVDPDGRKVFDLAVSIEKDAFAHETLRLRSFRRLFGGTPPESYWQVLRGEADWSSLLEAHPREAGQAASEAMHLELSSSTIDEVRQRVHSRVSDEKPWVLIGGPPCQAYSLVGRARNRGIVGYVPEEDKRQTLYVEYLQILADHAPPVFVMENVKGLLSARVSSRGVFERIREDLSNPALALKREGRRSGGRHPRYLLHALAPEEGLGDGDPRRFVVRSERHGVPQRRHRIIMVGVLEESGLATPRMLRRRKDEPTVASALLGLPPLRSGLSRQEDSSEAWLAEIRSIHSRRWLSEIPSELSRDLRTLVQTLRAPRRARGSELWTNGRGDVVLNHASRSHIASDIERYLFAALFGARYGRSPILGDYPEALLPAHANVSRAIDDGVFSDRFRVQLAAQPSTTITSHIAKDGHYYIHFDARQCRSFSVREAARLQTFPDDYFFSGPRTEQYKQVGNAVPPKLARQIAGSVASVLRGWTG